MSINGFIDTNTAARFLRITPKTLRGLCRLAKIVHYKDAGKTSGYRFKESDLLAYMERHKVEAKI